MKLYLAKRDGLSDPIVVGIFTSLEIADKAVQEWCHENDHREWKHFPKETDDQWTSLYKPVYFPNTRREYYDSYHSIYIEEIDANKFEIDGIGYYCGN